MRWGETLLKHIKVTMKSTQTNLFFFFLQHIAAIIINDLSLDIFFFLIHVPS